MSLSLISYARPKGSVDQSSFGIKASVSAQPSSSVLGCILEPVWCHPKGVDNLMYSRQQERLVCGSSQVVWGFLTVFPESVAAKSIF